MKKFEVESRKRGRWLKVVTRGKRLARLHRWEEGCLEPQVWSRLGLLKATKLNEKGQKERKLSCQNLEKGVLGSSDDLMTLQVQARDSLGDRNGGHQYECAFQGTSVLFGV